MMLSEMQSRLLELTRDMWRGVSQATTDLMLIEINFSTDRDNAVLIEGEKLRKRLMKIDRLLTKANKQIEKLESMYPYYMEKDTVDGLTMKQVVDILSKR